MPSRAYVAHDRAVSAARMYIQMAVVGFVLASTIYVGAMSAIVSRYLAAPIPELLFVGGKPRVIFSAKSRRLSFLSIIKYYYSLNPKNYLSFQISASRLGTPEKSEIVEPELRVFLHSKEVPREAYRRAILWITHGRVEHLRWIFPTSLLFFPLFGLVYFLAFSRLNGRAEKTRFVRGADLMPFKRMSEALVAAIKVEGNDGPSLIPLRLGEACLPDSVSRRHILVLGTTGTGKSVCLNHYLTSLKERRGSGAEVNKCVVYDVKGEFCGKHFDPGDLVFYPFDRRSVPWSFFNEVRDYPDLDVLGTSLYAPPKDSKDPYWYNAARDIFRTGLFYLLREGRKSNRDIWEFFSQPLQQIRDSLYTLPVRELGALKHIDKADSNQAASVVSILQERLTFFRYLTDRDGAFSFRSFIHADDDRRNLFLMNIRQYDAIFRPLMTFVIDIMTREVLSLADSFNRRITFIVDDFGSLDKMPCIFDFLTMGRSKGGFLVLANQDLGSVSSIYGSDQKETFFNNFNVHLVFRLNDPTTAEFLSKAFGEREVIKKFQSSQFSPNDLGDRFSMREQEKLEKIILPTEFQNLQDFDAYLKIANYGLTRMKTPREFLPKIDEEFVPRDFG
ncbi:MAG TPA: type IV secretion system DNA-binding domain-containing protein, partial [Acidobacteriota bacterium]|nr:type IV secretion system DNA-binding domain-containing protein [Acidobacteriota bacterium]